MGISVVRLGTARTPHEGLRIGTVRRPPRDVSKDRYAKDDWFDAWLPELAPSAELVKLALAASSPSQWSTFARRYRAEMRAPAAAHLLALLASLSQETNLAVGCYCEDERRCHRSVLRELLHEHGARVVE